MGKIPTKIIFLFELQIVKEMEMEKVNKEKDSFTNNIEVAQLMTLFIKINKSCKKKE